MHANDWLYAIRTLRRNPRFTLAAALTLAVGLGASTAIFSFMNAVYLRPLSYPQPERLVSLWETGPNGKGNTASASAYLDWRKDTALFAGVGAWAWDVVTLSGGPWPERPQAQRVTGDYFRILGAQPARGRLFLPEDERPGAACAVIVGERFWRGWFGAATDLESRPVAVEGAPCRVIGVMPETFLPPIGASIRVDAWLPLPLDAAQSVRKDRFLVVLARLAPGVTLEQARGRVNGSRQSADGVAARLISLHERIAGRLNPALLSLAGAVGFLLLIACINVATLLTARAAGQRREMAIRSALGAGRGRLMAHLLAQTLLLSLLGGAGGLLLSYWSRDALVALAHGTLPLLDEVRLDWRVFAFSGALSILTGVLFGLAPAAGISRASLRETLQARGRRRVLRQAQVAAEIAIAFVLLAGAGLLMRSLHAIRAVDLGIRTEHVLSANFALPPSRYKDPRQYVRFLNDVLESVRAVPGVLSATATMGVPMRGSAGGSFEIFGRAADPGERLEAEFRPGDADYLSTLGMTLDHGRAFTSRDADGAPPVALVNQKLARQFFGSADPVGQQIRATGKNGPMPWMTIAGVVRDTRHTGPLRDSMLEIYVPFAQFRSTALQPRALIVRAAGDPERLVPSLQRAVASVDKEQPLVSISSMEQNLAEFIAPQRFDTTLMAIFAAAGLALAAVGIFGVMSYRVTQRTHEIGVRMALGAEDGDMLRMVLADGLRAAACGLALGWAGAWALTRLLSSLLFHVKPGDPLTLILASVVALATSAAASYLPARRASRMDPMAALRQQT